MIRLVLFCLCFLLPAHSVLADPATAARAKTSADHARTFYASPKAIQDNLSTPVISGTAMTAFDGRKFNAQIGCPSSSKFLEIFIAPGPTGDISAYSFSQDTDLDGSTDHVYAPGVPISAVCANGVVSCTPGTFSDCQHYLWTANTANKLSFLAVPKKDLGGCYCINNSCGSDLVMGNLSKVLSDLGGGASGALAKRSPYFAISNLSISGPTLQLFGQKTSDCRTGPTDTPAYRESPVNLNADAFAATAIDRKYALITTSAAASADPFTKHSCSIDRSMSLTEVSVNDIIQWKGGTGNMTSCGTDCVEITMGNTDNIGKCKAGSCCLKAEHKSSIEVLKPERIVSATLLRADYDDWLQVATDGDLIWSGPHSWSGLTADPPMDCGIGGDRTALSVDFTSHLTKGGVIPLMARVAHRGTYGYGQAKAQVHLDTSCKTTPDVIIDGCEALNTNPSCQLMEEVIDGVQTHLNFVPTGLTPIPTSRTLLGATCSLDVTREFWNRTRTYRCTGSKTYDFDDAMARVDHVQNTTTASSYEDRIKDGASVTLKPGTLTLLAEVPVPNCQTACKTRRPRVAMEVGDQGPAQSFRTETQTYDTLYRECVEDACPIEAGEEILKPCACLNEFPEATATLQALREAGKDLICSGGGLATP